MCQSKKPYSPHILFPAATILGKPLLMCLHEIICIFFNPSLMYLLLLLKFSLKADFFY